MNTKPLFDHFENSQMNDIDEEMYSSSQENSDDLQNKNQKHRRISMDSALNYENKREMQSHFESINEAEKEDDFSHESDLEIRSVQEELPEYFDEFGQL